MIDEDYDYREEDAQRRAEIEQRRKWARNAGLHVLDPDRVWEEEE